jgi:hypothetical protein
MPTATDPQEDGETIEAANETVNAGHGKIRTAQDEVHCDMKIGKVRVGHGMMTGASGMIGKGGEGSLMMIGIEVTTENEFGTARPGIVTKKRRGTRAGRLRGRLGG